MTCQFLGGLDAGSPGDDGRDESVSRGVKIGKLTVRVSESQEIRLFPALPLGVRLRFQNPRRLCCIEILAKGTGHVAGHLREDDVVRFAIRKPRPQQSRQTRVDRLGIVSSAF